MLYQLILQFGSKLETSKGVCAAFHQKTPLWGLPGDTLAFNNPWGKILGNLLLTALWTEVYTLFCGVGFIFSVFIHSLTEKTSISPNSDSFLLTLLWNINPCESKCLKCQKEKSREKESFYVVGENSWLCAIAEDHHRSKDSSSFCFISSYNCIVSGNRYRLLCQMCRERKGTTEDNKMVALFQKK